MRSLLPAPHTGNGERERPAAEGLQMAPFRFTFVLRKVRKHHTQRHTQQSTPAPQALPTHPVQGLSHKQLSGLLPDGCSSTLCGAIDDSRIVNPALDCSHIASGRHKSRIQGTLDLLMVVQPPGTPRSVFLFLPALSFSICLK